MSGANDQIGPLCWPAPLWCAQTGYAGHPGTPAADRWGNLVDDAGYPGCQGAHQTQGLIFMAWLAIQKTPDGYAIGSWFHKD